MAANENISMALFCDFENVALGVRDAKFDKFDIKPILERLLLKGSIVVKKAYCDWDRYKTFKAAMHEANFELIEIPHVRQSGKNSADIRLVVDALDLCYTKSHVNTFVIISGDSDFSPLVSKLRENAKQVIGVGVKQSTSDLLIANCDEFIFYDDLVRETARMEAKREERKSQPGSNTGNSGNSGNSANSGKRASNEEARANREELEAKRREAIHMAVATFDALISERGDSGKIWASTLKNAIKRRKPDFNEGNYGFRTFGSLLEEAQNRGQLQLSRDDKSGTYVYRSNLAGVALAEAAGDAAPVEATAMAGSTQYDAPAAGETGGEASSPDQVTNQPSDQALASLLPEDLQMTLPSDKPADSLPENPTSDASHGERESRHKGRNSRRPSGKTGERAQGERKGGRANYRSGQDAPPALPASATAEPVVAVATTPAANPALAEGAQAAANPASPDKADRASSRSADTGSAEASNTALPNSEAASTPSDHLPGEAGKTLPAKKRPARPRTPRAPRTRKAESGNESS